MLMPYSSIIENIIGQVSSRIDLLKVTYTGDDFDMQDIVSSILAKRKDLPFSVDTKKPNFSGENFLSLIFVDDFEQMK